MERYEYAIKVPKDRVGVLIGHKGEKKHELEDVLGVTLQVDSDEGEVRLIGQDTIKLFTAQEVIKAIARGFNPDIAKLLLKTDYVLEMITMTDFANGKNQMLRLKGRVIGEGGKSWRTIEELSETFLSVYGKTICIIGEADAVTAAKRAVETLLEGAPHSTVFRLLEKWRREKKRRDIQEFNQPRAD